MKFPEIRFLTPPRAALTWHILPPRPKSHVQITGSRASGRLQAARSVAELSPARQLSCPEVSLTLSQCLLAPSMILCFVGCCNLWSSGVATVLWPVAQGAEQVIWKSPVRAGQQVVSSITQSLGRRKNVVMHSTPNKSFQCSL